MSVRLGVCCVTVPAGPMSTTLPDDILLPRDTDSTDRRPNRSRIVAFVPITIAVIGVAAILLGRITVDEIAGSRAIDRADPMTTGSIESGAR
jgi:hypothetical protein